MKKPKRHRVSIMLDEDLYQQLERAAMAADIKIGAVVTVLMWLELRRAKLAKPRKSRTRR